MGWGLRVHSCRKSRGTLQPRDPSACVAHRMAGLQWGGRFASTPDASLLAFGSSLGDDLFIARWDALCSLGHVAALRGGGIISEDDATVLTQALNVVSSEIADGSFGAWAIGQSFEDVHGAIDARVRELAG